MAIANKTQQAVSKLNETIQAGAEKIGDFVSNANETIQGAIANGTEGGPPTPCCRAATAECLACSAGVTVEEFCAGEGNAVGCDDDDEGSSDDGRRRLQQDIGQNAAEKGQEIGQNFADAGKQIADNAVSASQDFVDGLNDTLTEGGAKLNDTLREGASNLNDTLWDGAAKLNDTLREGASSLNDTLREGASNAVNKTKDTLSDGVQNVQDNASDRRDARKEGDDEGSSDDGRRRLQQFDGLENVVGTVAKGVQTAINATTDALQGLGDRVQSGAQNLVNRTETFVSNANDTIQGMISRNRTGRGDDNATMPPQPCCKAMNAKCLSCTENMTEEEYCGMFPETIGCDELGEEEKEGRRGAPTSPWRLAATPPGR